MTKRTDMISLIQKNIERIKRYANFYFMLPYRMATAKKRALPDFLIIGTQKGGTRSLYHFLNQHPQVHMPVSISGELHYFDRGSNYKKGELWYRSHFPLKDKIKLGDIAGEATPSYLRFQISARRIKKDLPDAKLVCLLRNPTERAISNYFMTLRHKKEHLPILAAMKSDRGMYRRRGLYFDQLRHYESYLKKNQLLILSSEEFFSQPRKVLKQVYKFLGIDETFVCPKLSPRNIGKNKVPVPSEVYEYLDKYFKPHNRRLYNYLHRDFGW